ncbi:MAG: hypothetical protein HY720_05610 [Planctomycetes bacterium]|nr:hypothetical protein [Planctomycetota bacterium]
MSHPSTFRLPNRSAFLTLFLLAAVGVPGARAQVPEEEVQPFFIGTFVGANVFEWGDLRAAPGGPADLPGIVDDLADRGLNAVWVTGFDGGMYGDISLMRVWLDAAGRRGVKVVLQGSGVPYVIQRQGAEVADETLRAAREEVAPAWAAVARTYGRHPALLAYSPVEEIGDNVELGENQTLRALAEVARAVAEVDPLHPTTTIHIASWSNVAIEEARLRRDGPGRIRVIVYDNYPFSHPIPDWADVSDPALAAATPAEAVSMYVEFLDRWVAIGRDANVPVWVMAQGHSSTWTRVLDGVPVTRALSRAPTEAEMRLQIWAAVLAGAKGIFFFQYHSSPRFPPEIEATLQEWEVGTGLRTLDGEATPSYEALAVIATSLKPHLDRIGRLEPDGGPAMGVDRVPGVLARGFRDPANGTRWVVVLNRDIEAPRTIAAGAEVAGVRLAADLDLAPGDGTILEVRE